MKTLNKKDIDKIINIIRTFNELFTQLNKETYYNLVTSAKYISKKKIVDDENSNLRIYKTQICSMMLALDDIRTEIEKFMEEINGEI